MPQGKGTLRGSHVPDSLVWPIQGCLDGTFHHDRCIDCYGMASENAMFNLYKNQNYFPVNTNVLDATTCSGCHGAVPGWSETEGDAWQSF